VKLHNDMQRAPPRKGFSLLNHDVQPLLVEDAAFHKFNEMSTIGPWIDRQGMLQWDYVSGAGFKGSRSVRKGDLRKDALIESDGNMLNDKGEWCIKGYRDMGILGNTVKGKVHKANALGKHHTHICISAICQRGASISWQKGYPVIFHHCYDPEQSGLAGQTARSKKGLQLHICKQCHRTAQECEGTGCLAPCRNSRLK